jgi:predicted signal transduction protein with EAL and GGDEF domain/DNA-binding NarL/FixJ family response regulator
MNTTQTTGCRILVVDDDAGGRRLTRATLSKAGFVVIEAADGAQAVDLLRQGLPDLVLMDVSMPVMDGFTACAELRKLPGGARVPVVMMTGLDDVKSIEHAFEVGASDFITKPLNWAILPHRVRYMLRASKAINHLDQNQRRLSNAQRIGEMGDWEWDVQQDRVVPSEQAARIFGHPVDRGVVDLAAFLSSVHAQDAERVRLACERAVASGDAFAIDHRIVLPDGSLRQVHQQVEVIERDEQGQARHLAGAVHDVTRRKDAEEQIRQLAYFDALTGLPNRVLFGEQVQKAISQAERRGTQLAVMFVDLDHFKRVNDTLGHGAGDELLRLVSTRLASLVREVDSVMHHEARPSGFANSHVQALEGNGATANTAATHNSTADVHSIARLGGDEFIVLMTDVQRPDDAAAVARRLVAALAEPVTVQGTEIFVGGSVGVAMYPADGADINTLMMNADTAMYRAKAAGRGGFQFYDRSMNARALERLMMETRLRRALERDEFVLHYQPRVDVRSGRIVGAEALVRWQDPERGLLLPGEFIPLMEDAGLVIPIGEWVLRAASKQIAQWRQAGVRCVPVAVNLASTHLRELQLPRLVGGLMVEHGLLLGSLEIEVTESILLTDPETSLDIARRLRDMGVPLSIDDFGTGYSSMSYLKRLPIASLKIDRSFVRDLETDPDDEAIVTAIIALAHSLKLKVVAEGVETPAQLAFLRSRRCDEYQGFLTSKAVDHAAFARLVERLDTEQAIEMA